ncbi:hypothetical protein MP638_000964 [Amoeboaphelidium occidentale]|nr:hypothetical protein MP638_000964 [Amoeboaphelidium occidentale]
MLLFCDLQGGIYQDGFVITDPGQMEYRHKKEWMTPEDKKTYFQVQKGSAMVLLTRVTRNPLSGRVSNESMNQLPSLIGKLVIIED